MAKLEAVLGLSSVSAKLFEFDIRVHGHTLARFAAFLNLNDALINKHIATLSSATLEYLEKGSRHAGTSAWMSIRELEKAMNRIPLTQHQNVLYDLERYTQMLLARDDELASLIAEDIDKFRITRLAKIAKNAAKQPSAAEAIVGQWRANIMQTGGNVLKIFKHFESVVGLDSAAISKASAYIRDNEDSIRRAEKAVDQGDMSLVWGHLSGVRGLLGEAYALMSRVWRAKHHRALLEAKKLARTMGPDYEVVAISQLENKIFLDLRESADQMILIINRKDKQAITFVSAQVKTANTSEAIDQTMKDVFKREASGVAHLDFVYEGVPLGLTLIQDSRVTAQRYILNAAESRIPAADLDVLKERGVTITEVVLDMTVSQFSLLAIRMIEEGLKVLKKAKTPPG